MVAIGNSSSKTTTQEQRIAKLRGERDCPMSVEVANPPIQRRSSLSSWAWNRVQGELATSPIRSPNGRQMNTMPKIGRGKHQRAVTSRLHSWTCEKWTQARVQSLPILDWSRNRVQGELATNCRWVALPAPPLRMSREHRDQ